MDPEAVLMTTLAVRRGRGRAIAALVGRRVAFGVPLLLIVSLGMFALAKATPFDPVQRYFGVRIIGASAHRVAQIRANWGLGAPLLTQYGAWLAHAVTGDFGDSHSLQQPVSQVIGERLGWSVLLLMVAFAGALLLGIVMGTTAAWRQGGWLDRAITASSYALEAAPVFWLGLGALYVFAVALRWLPGGGLADPGAALSAGQLASHLVLPAAVLAVSQAPWFVLFVRQTLLEALTEDYVLGARSRGLPERTVVVNHALRTALLPFLTLLGARVPELITGALLVETVFSWPGIAKATVDAALNVDFSLLAALTLLATAAVLAGNLLADVLYALADPRVGLDG
ncbi:MAG TPA: ABC transporter permease [Pseudonocardiaceae bacterium]|nr:ABC transporter permease [Pseudonocardiaceae bacterium]